MSSILRLVVFHSIPYFTNGVWRFLNPPAFQCMIIYSVFISLLFYFFWLLKKAKNYLWKCFWMENETRSSTQFVTAIFAGMFDVLVSFSVHILLDSLSCFTWTSKKNSPFFYFCPLHVLIDVTIVPGYFSWILWMRVRAFNCNRIEMFSLCISVPLFLWCSNFTNISIIFSFFIKREREPVRESERKRQRKSEKHNEKGKIAYRIKI